MADKPTYEDLERRVKELENEAARGRVAEEALRDSEKRLSQIVEGIPIALFVVDRHHKMTLCNRAWEAMTGIPAREFIGTRKQWKTFYETERPVMADLIVDQVSEDVFERHYRGKYRKSDLIEGAYEAENFFPALGEKGRWVFFTAAPLKDEDNRIVGAIETLQDVTERKRAENLLRETERRLGTLLDFVPYPMVVFTVDGRVYYVNPAFSETFGWSFKELAGKNIPYVPPGLEQETSEMIKRLLEERIVLRHETKRLTKDGRILDVVMRAAVYLDEEGKPLGELVILRDITEEKRMARNNEAVRLISMALPEYPDLEDLLDYVSEEVKNHMNSEGALVILQDEETQELYFLGAAYDDETIQERIKEIRFPMNKLVAGQVIKTGEAAIINDTSGDPELYRERDEKMGYHTRNLLLVPMRSSDRIIGSLAAINKKEGPFDDKDKELLNIIAGTVTLSIENARFAEDLKRAYRQTEILLRISMNLPKYPELGERLDYISGEVKRLLGSEGALVLLLDPDKEELYITGACYDDRAVEERMKQISFHLDEVAAGRVIRTGETVIVNDSTKDQQIYPDRDKKLGYQTKNFVEVPLRSRGRNIGILAAINKKSGRFEQMDAELLSMIAGTVALSVENARFSDELKHAYQEVSSLNRAKDKVIHHLSHELKTPVAVLAGSLNVLERKMEEFEDDAWRSTLDRARRNLDRIVGIQAETDDIIQEKRYETHNILSLLLDQSADELETLIAEEAGEGPAVKRIRQRIEEIFGPKELSSQSIALDQFVEDRLDALAPQYAKRRIKMRASLCPSVPVFIPADALRKVFDGLLKNAIENTPDQGSIEITVGQKGEGTELTVRDYGVGIPEEFQKRIFEGFFTTRDTMAYSTKRPFAFNAGGKGIELLRMKIFSQRYHFRIHMVSNRCPVIPEENDVCPGSIDRCPACNTESDCLRSGGTTFSLYFPPAPDAGEEKVRSKE